MIKDNDQGFVWLTERLDEAHTNTLQFPPPPAKTKTIKSPTPTPTLWDRIVSAVTGSSSPSPSPTPAAPPTTSTAMRDRGAPARGGRGGRGGAGGLGWWLPPSEFKTSPREWSVREGEGALEAPAREKLGFVFALQRTRTKGDEAAFMGNLLIY
ncbi:hypothetical protein Pelo_19665 [Pelomyxa schiedti]|nr:hypothetical protein Pelo_19665 [Pelomyxa schiedti]